MGIGDICCLPGRFWLETERSNGGIATFKAGENGQILSRGVVKDGERHNHSAFEGGISWDGVDALAGWNMEYVDLIYQLSLDDGQELTVSELNVFGTAISSSSGAESEREVGDWANEQKFMVLTCRTCRSHGCLRGSGTVSTGSTLLIELSSSSENFHTMSLLSFPCLQYPVRSDVWIWYRRDHEGSPLWRRKTGNRVKQS